MSIGSPSCLPLSYVGGFREGRTDGEVIRNRNHGPLRWASHAFALLELSNLCESSRVFP